MRTIPINYKKLREIIDEVLISDGIRLPSYAQIAKKIIVKCFPDINVYQESFENIKRKFDEEFKIDTPENEEDFYTYVCKDICGINSLPINNFINEYENTVSKLERIDQNIKKCEEKKNKILLEKTKNGFCETGQNYQIKLLDYYIEKNRTEKEKLVNFLVYNIKGKACGQADLFGSALSLFSQLLESLDIRMRLLDIDNFNEINNKFQELPYPDYLELQKIFKENKESFKEITIKYIEDNKIEAKILCEVNKNYLLIQKKETITKILDAYRQKDYFVFNNLVPLFIEGIFADICKELGCTEKELNISSLNDKLDLIRGKIEYFHIYEYFAFVFPVLRNKTAHGDLENTEDEYLANMLLLDLLSVVEFANADELPFNAYRKIIEELYQKQTDEFYDRYILNPECLDEAINPFYTENYNHLKELREKVESKDFARYVINKSGSILFTPKQILKVLCGLKKKKIELDKVQEAIKNIHKELKV